MPPINRSQFQHTKSVRERIVQDPESTDTLLLMVHNARKVLVKDKKYQTFRSIISEVISKYEHLNEPIKGARNRELFSCGGMVPDDGPQQQQQQQQQQEQQYYTIEPSTSYLVTEGDVVNQLIDGFIIELLRFLSMKILLESVPSTVDASQICQRMPSMANVTSRITTGMEMPTIIPSAPLCDGWKGLLLLPMLYHDVCCAMGCDGRLDFDEEAVTLHDKQNRRRGDSAMLRKKRQDYRYTLVTYEKLFLDVPTESIWCRLEQDEEDDRDDSFYDGFRDFVDSVSRIIKEKIKGPSRGVPESILIS